MWGARIACVLLLCAGLLSCKPGEPLPKLGQVPAFSLQDQDGVTSTAESLRGKVWIADFVFTSCPDVCPLLTGKLRSVRTQLAGERAQVRLVSFSVDPETDKPPVLKRFAQEHGAAQDDWRFLTGPIERIEQVVTQGFKQAITRQPAERDKPANIMHGSHFVLVDQHLQIRGFYRSDEDGMARLVRDTRRLVHGKADG